MSELAPGPRALCATTAAWLSASRSLSFPALASVALATLHLAHGGALWLSALAVLLLVLAERYLALRLAFDARVFEALAQGHIESSADFDAALRQLGFAKAAQAERSIEDRVGGAMRLWRWHVATLLLQLALALPLLLAELQR
jgi:hypothetical protein